MAGFGYISPEANKLVETEKPKSYRKTGEVGTLGSSITFSPGSRMFCPDF